MDLAEALVESNQNLSVPMRVRKNVRVTRIARPVRSRFDVVAGGGERLAGAAADAAVEEYLHTFSKFVSAGSTRSWPTTRRA